MSSLAQDESRSLSENVTWGKRKRMAGGSVSISYSRVLGFKKGSDRIEVEKLVKRIFRMFLQGYTPYTISKILTDEQIDLPARLGSWHPQTIRSMLANEKNKGDAILEKGFTVDYLTKKRKKNEGELPQYYVTENHEAIIEPLVFDYVYGLLRQRGKIKKSRYSGVEMLNSKVNAEHVLDPDHGMQAVHTRKQCGNVLIDIQKNNVKQSISMMSI